MGLDRIIESRKRTTSIYSGWHHFLLNMAGNNRKWL